MTTTKGRHAAPRPRRPILILTVALAALGFAMHAAPAPGMVHTPRIAAAAAPMHKIFPPPCEDDFSAKILPCRGDGFTMVLVRKVPGGGTIVRRAFPDGHSELDTV